MRVLSGSYAVLFALGLFLLVSQPLYAQGIKYLPGAPQTQQKSNSVILVAPVYYVKVTYPNGGEIFPLDGAYQSITFSAFLDAAKDKKYKFQLELWRAGKKVGSINPSPQEFSLKNIESGFGMPQYQTGAYYVSGGGPFDYYVASPGSGYRVRVATYLDEKLIASDESDESFSFTSAPPRGEPRTELIKPNGGDTYELGKGANVEFTYRGLDPYKANQYDYALELWRFGKRLGQLIGRHSLNVRSEKLSVSENIDNYQNPETLKPVKSESGGGYTLRIVIYERDTPITHDDSDTSFSFTESHPTKNSNLTINTSKTILEPLQNLWERIKKLFSR